MNKDQVLLAFAEPCTDRFRDEITALPGVKAAACSSAGALAMVKSISDITVENRKASVDTAAIDFGFFEVYGVKPLAGRLFQRARPADGFHSDPQVSQPVIINQTAARALGYASDEAAIGKSLTWHGPLGTEHINYPARASQIIGVVPDFSFGSVRATIPASLYYVGDKAAYCCRMC